LFVDAVVTSESAVIVAVLPTQKKLALDFASSLVQLVREHINRGSQ